MKYHNFTRLVCVMSLSVLFILGAFRLAGAQDNTIHINPAIGDQGDKYTQYSLAYYISISKGLPKTIVLPAPSADGFQVIPENMSTIYMFNTSFTIPRNITLVIPNGARIKTADGIYLNIHGSIQAGNYQIFESGTVVYLKGSVAEAPFEWWGAHSIEEKADDIGDWSKWDSGPAINAAVLAASHIVGSPGAAYLIKTPVTLSSLMTLDGRNCLFVGDPSIDATQSMFIVKDQKNVLLSNFRVRLNKAKRFLYIFGSRDVTLTQVLGTEPATSRDYKFIDIHNSYHCFIKHVTLNGGAPKTDNGSVGILIRSDLESGGFTVVDNIGIDDTTIGICWTGILLNFKSASNNILLRNVSILGKKPTEIGSFYGIRSIGTARLDFLNIDGFHMECMPRGITFAKCKGFTISVRNARFSDVRQVFNLYGTLKDKMSVQMIDFRATAPGAFYGFYHLDASVKKLDEWNSDPEIRNLIKPKEGNGVIR